MVILIEYFSSLDTKLSFTLSLPPTLCHSRSFSLSLVVSLWLRDFGHYLCGMFPLYSWCVIIVDIRCCLLHLIGPSHCPFSNILRYHTCLHDCCHPLFVQYDVNSIVKFKLESWKTAWSVFSARRLENSFSFVPYAASTSKQHVSNAACSSTHFVFRIEQVLTPYKKKFKRYNLWTSSTISVVAMVKWSLDIRCTLPIVFLPVAILYFTWALQLSLLLTTGPNYKLVDGFKSGQFKCKQEKYLIDHNPDNILLWNDSFFANKYV